MTLQIMAICTKIYTILIQKDPRRQDITNFSSKIIKIMRSSKCLKTTVELTFTAQKANACSPCTTFSVFTFKAFIKLFEGPQRSVKMKI